MANVQIPTINGQASEPLEPTVLRLRQAPHYPLESQIALRCDGVFLLSTSELSGCDLAGYERFEAIVLPSAQSIQLLARLQDSFAEAAARITAQIPKKQP